MKLRPVRPDRRGASLSSQKLEVVAGSFLLNVPKDRLETGISPLYLFCFLIYSFLDTTDHTNAAICRGVSTSVSMFFHLFTSCQTATNSNLLTP